MLYLEKREQIGSIGLIRHSGRGYYIDNFCTQAYLLNY
jgi:hypothetical protein